MTFVGLLSTSRCRTVDQGQQQDGQRHHCGRCWIRDIRTQHCLVVEQVRTWGRVYHDIRISMGILLQFPSAELPVSFISGVDTKWLYMKKRLPLGDTLSLKLLALCLLIWASRCSYLKYLNLQLSQTAQVLDLNRAVFCFSWICFCLTMANACTTLVDEMPNQQTWLLFLLSLKFSNDCTDCLGDRTVASKLSK